MKFIIELNLDEVESALKGGTLKKLLDCSSKEKTVREEIYNTETPQKNEETPQKNEEVKETIIEIPIETKPEAAPQKNEETPQNTVLVIPTAIPTANVSYTLDNLAVAATQLVDAGKRDAVVNLLASFGVNSMIALPQEQYGAFATQLRALGVKI